MLVLARELGRFPSEIYSMGSAGFRVVLKSDGDGGFIGELQDTRPPITGSELMDMMSLFLLEKEEAEEARENAREI